MRTAVLVFWRVFQNLVVRVTLLGVVAVLILAAYQELLRITSRVKRLPGPRGWPVVGNLFQVKGKPAYEIYRKWAQQYGPVFQVQFGNLPLVIINDAQSAHDLLVKQHSALISRPVLYTFHQSVNTVGENVDESGSAFAGFSIGTSPWDLSTKRRRRAAATALNIPATKSYANVSRWHAFQDIRSLRCDSLLCSAWLRDKALLNKQRIAAKTSPFQVRSCLTTPAIHPCEYLLTPYIQILDFETREFVRELLEETDNGKQAIYLRPLIYHLSINMSLTLNYGTRLLTKDSPLFKEIFEVEKAISGFRSTSENLQDFFPVLRYLRNPFKKASSYARDIGDRRKAFNYKLLDELQARVYQNTDTPSIQSNVMRDPDAKLTRSELLGISLSIVAGADSSTPTMGWIAAFLVRHPEWQERLYDELRAHRDQNSFETSWGDAHEVEVPIVDAFIKEILRFYPPLRGGIPRATYTDLPYGNAVIPPKTTALLNIWACNRDPAVFEEPNQFIPERWLKPENKANVLHVNYAFGLGARMCPASFLTYRLLYLTLVRLVWSFTLHPSPTSHQPEDDPILGATSTAALGTPPDPYDVVLKPRNLAALTEMLGEKPSSFGQ